MSGELVLRGMSEQPFSESEETLLPTLRVIQIFGDSELLRLTGSLLSGSSPPPHEENHEDESAPESHEENLPPLEFVGIDLRGSGGINASDAGQWRYGRRSGGLRDHDELG